MYGTLYKSPAHLSHEPKHCGNVHIPDYYRLDEIETVEFAAERESGNGFKRREIGRLTLWNCPERRERWVSLSTDGKVTLMPFRSPLQIRSAIDQIPHRMTEFLDSDTEWRADWSEWSGEPVTWPEYVSGILTCWRDGIIPHRQFLSPLK